ncbi:MAG: hypothetical protein QOH81_2709 [Sphingomonadales bacterium]|jgi:hypothetical protein|nr:hypothetical protein [Sphingomonadales bacterium]
MGNATTTTDHDEIRRWAEARGGHPARVRGTEILRIDFDERRGDDDEALERIGWEEFFDIFDRERLAFLHEDRTEDGKQSRFNKFVRRDG